MSRKIVIEASNITKRFNDMKVLDGVSFNLYEKENLVILGRSGTGKSVLLKSIVGLIKPDNGTLKVLDKDVCCLSDRELMDIRRKVGFLFQGGALYDSMTVRENLEFPLVRKNASISKEELEEAIMDVLESVGLKNTVNKMPGELSGGMQKRIALARTLVLKPEIMLYDEPTTGLDPVTSQEISRLINKMREKYNMSSLVITHDMACAKSVGDRIFLLSEGRFQEEGDFESLRNSDNAYIKAFFH
ncbi:ATP-binding cassette domain-containing protein [Cytophagaceae bacterium ABcell3]|nr:ATP-binding cassette domain-containing protein [Cytophagaceae bacterium ABcell3]